MGKWKNRLLWSVSVIGMVNVIGCSKPQSVENDLYLRCNDTSNGTMAEVEDGYYFVTGDILYYADKENLETWVPVCNKPDCMHDGTIQNNGQRCNAYNPLNNSIWQKDGRLYGIYDNLGIYIYEISKDGSGLKNVYEVPVEELIGQYEEIHLSVHGTFQDEFIINFWHLDEYGKEIENLVRLKEDENGEVILTSLYQGTEPTTANSGNQYWSIRGDNIIVDRRFLEEGDMLFDSLCVIKNDEVVPLNFPDDVSVYAGYLDGDIFTYYNPNEGFYQYNISTSEKELLFENALENAKGYILSEDYWVECNRYLDSMPEEAYLKFYNGENWIDVEVPEEVANCTNPFYPLCIASDRLFFRMSVTEDNKSTVFLYYMMLDEENPELVYAGKIGDGMVQEPVSEEETKEEFSGFYVDFEDVVVFDTEDYFLKITGAGESPEDENAYILDLYWENKSKEITYELSVNAIAINGLQCLGTGQSIGMLPETTSEQNDGSWSYGMTQLLIEKEDLENSGIDLLYGFEEFTDIAIRWGACDVNEWQEQLENKIVHVYPQGEENATHFVREPQSGDQILVDNEYVTVIATGYETDSTIHLLIQNKTNKALSYGINASAVNGLMEDRIATSTTASEGTLFAGNCVFASPTIIDSSFLSQHHITDIGKLEFAFRLSEMENGSVKNQLMDAYDILTAYPLGEENALHFVREAKSTDKVILDNEYVTLIATGYEASNVETGIQMNGDTLDKAVGLYIVNKTDQFLAVKIEDASLNGAMVNPVQSGEFKYLFPGNSELTAINFFSSELSPYGIKNIKEQAYEYVFTVFEPIVMDEVIVGSKKDLATTKFSFSEDSEVEDIVREAKEKDITLVEEDDVHIAFTGVEDKKMGNFVFAEDVVLAFYMENKTGKDMKVVVEDIVINGVVVDIEETFGVFVGMCRVAGIDVYSVMEEYGIESIKDVELSLRAYEYDYESGSKGKVLTNTRVKFERKN